MSHNILNNLDFKLLSIHTKRLIQMEYLLIKVLNNVIFQRWYKFHFFG